MIITSYSDFQKSLDEVPRSLKGKGLHKWFINNLKGRTRLSTFELSGMALDKYRAFQYLEKIGKIKLDNKNYTYPWIGVIVTR